MSSFLKRSIRMNKTTLYIDVENLIDEAREIIKKTVTEWPTEFPVPTAIQLYVSADKTHLWHIWITHQFPSIPASIIGIQRYTTLTKNSADMSLMLDALSDYIRGRTTHVAILSDDSDYIALFTALSKETTPEQNTKIPFIWFITDRKDTRSHFLDDFIPSKYFHCVKCEQAEKSVKMSVQEETKIRESEHGSVKSEIEKIAETIIREIPIGTFKSTDCIKIIKNNFPKNQMVKFDRPTFGNRFTEIIWPVLENFGVRLSNPDKRPRKYEMTEEAKNRIL